jgi:hypothetical protein
MLHSGLIVACISLVSIFFSIHLIGVNLYGSCGFTTISNASAPDDTIVLLIAVFYVCICACFLCLGLIAYVYLAKQLPEHSISKSPIHNA